MTTEPDVTTPPQPLHCTWCHVAGVRRLAVKSVDGTKTFDAVPADQCTYAGIGGVARSDKVANYSEAKAAYGALRTSNF